MLVRPNRQTEKKRQTNQSHEDFLRRQQLKSNSSLASGTDKHQQQIEEDTDTLPSANGNGPQLNPLLLSPKTKTTTTTTNVGQHSQAKPHFSKQFFPLSQTQKITTTTKNLLTLNPKANVPVASAGRRLVEDRPADGGEEVEGNVHDGQLTVGGEETGGGKRPQPIVLQLQRLEAWQAGKGGRVDRFNCIVTELNLREEGHLGKSSRRQVANGVPVELQLFKARVGK